MLKRLKVVMAGVVLVAFPALAAERIRDFNSRIEVAADGQLTVTETIKVKAGGPQLKVKREGRQTKFDVEGPQIKHGIYRDFPTLYDAGLFRKEVPFEVVSVKRDGRTDGWHTEPLSNGLRLYIGKRDVLLGPGEYSYELTYRTANQIGFFDDHDELYWNATGNDWAFPIDKASATVVLPAGVARGRITHKAYTGPKGSRARDYQSRVDEQGRVHFETTDPLTRGEGLTIVVGWPKGIVCAPTSEERFAAFLRANTHVIIGGGGILLIGAYLVIVWMMVGRDPQKGPVTARSEPPEDISPAAARYLVRMGFDKKCFTSALVNMAVKGYVTIDENDGDFTVRRGSASEDVLDPEEKALKKTLAERFKGRHFHTNTLYILPAVLLSIAVVLGAGLSSSRGGEAEAPSEAEAFLLMCVMCVWFSFWTLICYALLSERRAVSASLLFFATWGFGAWMFTLISSIFMLPLLMAVGTLNVLFPFLLKAPTREGRRVMDAIEGFRRYLAPAEEARMTLDRGERSEELFERYLPYSLALDVEDAWAESLESALGRATAQRGYSPRWYHGRPWDTMGPHGFCSTLGSSLQTAVSSSSTAPGSNSGSGGSSGGGGGGGGGGGW